MFSSPSPTSGGALRKRCPKRVEEYFLQRNFYPMEQAQVGGTLIKSTGGRALKAGLSTAEYSGLEMVPVSLKLITITENPSLGNL